MSRNVLVCGCSLTYVPFGSDADLNCTTSPSLRERFCIIQYGMYTMPSSATNSNTPQWNACKESGAVDSDPEPTGAAEPEVPERGLEISNSMGYWILNEASASSADGGRIHLSPNSKWCLDGSRNDTGYAR